MSLAQPILTIFPPHTEPHQTICILGAPRGGTSMVAGIIRKLGVPMGADVDPANNEDRAFLKHNGSRELFTEAPLKAERAKYIKSIRKIIKRRNQQHDRWGWKDPISVFYIKDVLEVIRSPVFILVTRDPGAIAQRQTIEHADSTRIHILAGLHTVLIAYNQAVELILQRSRPTLLVSYERALRFPRQTGLAIAEFLGIEVSKEFLNWCGGYIEPDRLDGSIELNAPRQADDVLSSSSDAVRIMLGECLRMRRDGVLAAQAMTARSPTSPIDEAYEKAARAVNDGDFAATEDLGITIVAAFASEHPELLDGPMGVLSQSIAGPGPNPLYPDVVGAAFYLVGLSHVFRGSAQKAIVYFTTAEIMMRTRINTAVSDSILSRAIYVAAVFHMGFVAKSLQKGDLVAEVIRAFEGGRGHRFVRDLTAMEDWPIFSRRIAELKEA